MGVTLDEIKKRVNHFNELRIGSIVRWFSESHPKDITDCRLQVVGMDNNTERVWYVVVKAGSSQDTFWTKGKEHSEVFRPDHDGVGTYFIHKTTNFKRELGMRWTHAK